MGAKLDTVRLWTEKRSMNYFTVSAAKPRLGRLLDGVLKSGIPVVIRRGGRFLQISEYVVPHPTPQGSPTASPAAESPSQNGPANRLHFRISLFESDEGWAASCPDLPGCHSQGKNREEAGLKRVEQADVLV
jgi:hypothetical protein